MEMKRKTYVRPSLYCHVLGSDLMEEPFVTSIKKIDDYLPNGYLWDSDEPVTGIRSYIRKKSGGSWNSWSDEEDY